MQQYILAIDAGTTSSRAIVFNEIGETVSLSQYEFPQYFPKEGWVEHDADEIWQTQLKAIKEAIGQTHSEAASIAAAAASDGSAPPSNAVW